MKPDVARDFAFQKRFQGDQAMIARNVVRVEVAGWEDDAKRNTDFRVMRMANDWRITARVRRYEYRDRYRDQFTIRVDRPSGVPSEMDKMRAGLGDFGIYGFESEPGSNQLSPWLLYNTAILRQYLDGGGRWYHQANADETTFAAFDIVEVASAEHIGFVLNSEGLTMFDALWPSAWGPCRVCGHASWTLDSLGPVHACCAVAASPCPCCAASQQRTHARWGWP